MTVQTPAAATDSRERVERGSAPAARMPLESSMAHVCHNRRACTTKSSGTLRHVLLAFLLTAALCLHTASGITLDGSSSSSIISSSADGPFPLHELMLGVPHVTLTTSVNAKLPPGTPTASSAFVNQHMKLLNFLTLAIYMKVDAVVLPMASSQQSTVIWNPEPPSSLWDMRSIEALLTYHNIAHQVATWDDRVAPADAVSLPSFFCRALDIDVLAVEIARLSRQAIAKAASRPANVTLFAPDLCMALRTDNLPLFTQVAQAVHFAPALVHLAGCVVNHLHRQAPHFNALHLRVDHNQTNMAREVAEVTTHMLALNFTAAPLYVMGAVFNALGDVDAKRFRPVADWVTTVLLPQGLASNVTNHRGETAPGTWNLEACGEFKTNMLHSEQYSELDFLVMLRASRVVGQRLSPWSFMLREFRSLSAGGHHWNRSSMALVGPATMMGMYHGAASFMTEG